MTTTDRTPPHSLESEQHVLGAIIINNSLLNKIMEKLTLNDFYTPQHHAIFRALACLKNEGNPMDAISVGERANEIYGENPGYKFDLITYCIEIAKSAPHSDSSVDGYAEVVRERSALRQLISTANEIETLAVTDTKATPEELDLISSAIKRINTIFERNISQDHTGEEDCPVCDPTSLMQERLEQTGFNKEAIAYFIETAEELRSCNINLFLSMAPIYIDSPDKAYYEVITENRLTGQRYFFKGELDAIKSNIEAVLYHHYH